MSQKLIRVQRLKELMAARGYEGVNDFARALGRKSSQVSDLLRERVPFGERIARNIEETMQLPHGWLDGDEPDSSTSLYRQTVVELVTIPYVNVIATDGSPGFAVQPIEKPGMPVFFDQRWIDERGYRSASLKCTPVADDAMAGRMHKGDVVVINTDLAEPAEGSVFVVRYEESILLRRLMRDEGAWWLTCDNLDKSRFPRKKLTADTTLVGQVVKLISDHI